MHLLDIAEDLKGAPTSAERPDSNPASLPPQQKEASSFCSEHVKEELKLYCETCGELICPYCALKTGKHHNHSYELIEKAFDTYKKEVGSLLEPINEKLAFVDGVLTLFDKKNAEISDQRAAIEARIHHTIDRLHQVLDVRRTELISRVHQLTQRKLKDLVAQKDQAETVHAQLSSCQDFMKQSLETDCWGEALKMKTTVLKQVKELTTTVQPCALRPNTKADIEFSTSANITDLCHRFGQVSTLDSPDPSKCHATGKGLQAGIVGQTSTAVLQAFNREGEACKEPVTSLECKLVSEITGATATGSFKKSKGQNRYEISYQPTVKGRHQLHVSIQGQPIRESPFRPAVTSSIMNLGAPILRIPDPEVDYPRGTHGIAINHKGEIVFTERDHGISFYTPGGKKIRTINLEGLKLYCLTQDRDDNIIVGDNTNYSIRKYSPEGQLLASVGTRGTGRLQFEYINDISINTRNHKLYVADQNHRIQVLNSDYTFSHIFGRQGKDKGQFDSPSGITCDSAGNVYVTDSGNHRVQVFTAEGKFLRMFGKYGEARGALDWPTNIALDRSNKHIYISEMNNYRISVFTREGQFVTIFGVGNYVDWNTSGPCGLAVDNCGAVYVCDYHFVNNIYVF